MQFAAARRLYENVVKRKGPWADHRNTSDHYSDQQTIADLESSVRILGEIGGTLSHKPDRTEWLLHIAGVHWQMAQALLYLGRYKEAGDENWVASCLIPQVPSYLWAGPPQKQEYLSRYHFLQGEIALAESNTESAIMNFSTSRGIDEAIGDFEGVRKCDYYLRQLGVSPSKPSAPPTQSRYSIRMGIVMGRTAFLIVAFSTLILLGKKTGIDVWKPSGSKGITLLVISIVAGVLTDRLVRALWPKPRT